MGIHEKGAQARSIGPLGDEIRVRRTAAGLTLQQLADKAGCTKGYLSSIENHKRERPPSREILTALEGVLGVTDDALVRAAQWQAAGTEVKEQVRAMAEQSRVSEQLAALVREKGIDDAYKSGQLQSIVDQLAGHANIAPAPLPVQVPVINKVAAGYPTEFTDMGYPARIADAYVSTPDVRDPDAFAARVVGDSMAPAYREGDIVVFSPERDTAEGSDCFIRLERDSETTFKRVYFEEDGDGNELIRLQPLNSSFKPKTLPREDIAGMYAAVYVIRKAGVAGS